MSILFLFPPPFTKERLTPKLRANFLTDGLACAVLFSLLCTLSPIGIGVSLAAFFSGGSGAGRVGVCVNFSISSFFSFLAGAFASDLSPFIATYLGSLVYTHCV